MILHYKSAVLLDCCAVGAGAVAGALLRYGASKAQARYRMEPWAIPAINIAGSFVLGAISVTSGLDPRLKLMVGTGFCGALTTFSTFSVDTVTLLHKGKLAQAVGYVLVNNVGGILAAALAIKIFRGGSSSLPPPPPGASPRGGHQPIDSLVRAAGSAHPSPPPATSAQKHRLAAAAAASLPAPWGRSHWGLQQQQNLYRPLPSPPSASASLSYKRAQ